MVVPWKMKVLEPRLTNLRTCQVITEELVEVLKTPGISYTKTSLKEGLNLNCQTELGLMLWHTFDLTSAMMSTSQIAFREGLPCYRNTMGI